MFTVGFKYENGDLVTQFDEVMDTEKAMSLLKLKVYDTMALVIGKEKRVYRIMGIKRRYNTPVISGQNEENMHIDFILSDITK